MTSLETLDAETGTANVIVIVIVVTRIARVIATMAETETDATEGKTENETANGPAVIDPSLLPTNPAPKPAA